MVWTVLNCFPGSLVDCQRHHLQILVARGGADHDFKFARLNHEFHVDIVKREMIMARILSFALFDTQEKKKYAGIPLSISDISRTRAHA
jgi:hypothetical protein